MDLEGRYEPPTEDADAELKLDIEEPHLARKRRKQAPGKMSRTLAMDALLPQVRERGSERARRAEPAPSRDAGSAGAIQADGGRIRAMDPFAVHLVARDGVAGSGGSLPHLTAIQKAFGHHDVTGVHAHVGGAAADAAAVIGARAYATGDDVAFAGAPDLRQAAHEAAHVVQQRGGVRLDGGVGKSGDTYELHADAVAEKVVRGESAEQLLDTMAHRGPSGGPAVQREDLDGDGIDDGPAAGPAAETAAPDLGAWTSFAEAFNTFFADVLHVFGGRLEAAAAREYFTDRQRDALSTFISAEPHLIPDRLFNDSTPRAGATRQLTAGQRIMISAHILANGMYRRGSTEETQRMAARMCGHWVNMVNAYAGVAGSSSASGVSGNFDNSGNVVLGAGAGPTMPFANHLAEEGEAGTGNSVANLATFPFSRFDELQPGDWLWIYNGRSGGAGNHSVVFSNWVTGRDEGREPLQFRQAVTYDQLNNESGDGGRQHTIRLGGRFDRAQRIKSITRVERAREDARPATTVEELIPDVREPGDDTGPAPDRATPRGRNERWLNNHGIALADAKIYVRRENVRLMGLIDARLSADQRRLLGDANARDNLETLCRLNERLVELSTGSAALDRSDARSAARVAAGGFEVAQGSVTQAELNGGRADRRTTGLVTSVQNPIRAAGVEAARTEAAAAPVDGAASDGSRPAEPGGTTGTAGTTAPVQPKGELTGPDVMSTVSVGIEGDGGSLPFLDTIQASFGAHDVGGVRAHVGGAAATATASLGAEAYATGDDVAFHRAPDLHTAAHEAAHVVQQRAGVELDGGIGHAGDIYERQADAVADAVVRGDDVESVLDGDAATPAPAPVRSPALLSSGPAVPYREMMAQALGFDFLDVEVRLGDARGSGEGAYATVEGGRDVIAFDRTSPSAEQVAHELVHVAQRRRFGEGSGGLASKAAASEVEARDLAPRAAAGQRVDVREAPAGRVQRDDTVARSIREKLHGWITDDEAGALSDLRLDSNRADTIDMYPGLFGCEIWEDFSSNASGDILHQAMALCWPHMSLLERLETQLGYVDDDEQGILQTIRNATDAEVRTAASGIQPYLDQLDPADQFTARCRVWPDQAVENVGWLLSAGRGWVWDDEGPVATAVMNLTPRQRVQLWNDYEHLVTAMFSWNDREQIRRMCITDTGEMATDTDAARVRMELATDGAGTDEDGVLAAVAVAGSRRDEAARIDEALASGTAPDGTPLTEDQRATLERRFDEIGDIDGLLSASEGEGEATLDGESFLGRIEGDMDAGTLDAALATAHTGAFQRAKQALLGTVSWYGDVDEAAVLRIMREITGELELAEGETAEGLGADVVRTRRAESATRIRTALQEDPELTSIFGALGDALWDDDEVAMLDAVNAGDALAMVRLDLTEAFEGIDTDEAAILRILRDTTAEVRAQLRGVPGDSEHAPDPIIVRIRAYIVGYAAFSRAFEHTLETGQIPVEDALAEATGGDGDGTNVELINETLGTLTAADRAELRRGYLLAHSGGVTGGGICTASGDSPAERDERALARYQRIHDSLRFELGDQDLDAALVAMLDIPTVEEMRSADGAGRIDAARIMLYRQRERLELSAGWITNAFSATDDTAASAHVEFEAAYNTAMEGGELTVEEFAILVHLDTQFNDRFTAYSAASDTVANIAGSVAAIVVGIVAIALTDGAAAPTVAAWLSANGGILGGAAVVGAVAQVGTAELVGGDFHDSLETEGAREALSGALSAALTVAGAGLAEQAATFVGLSGPSLTAAIARAAAGSVEVSIAGRAFARGALMGLLDGALGGAIGDLAMTLTDVQTWRHSVWGVLARAGEALLRGGLMGATVGAVTGGIMETATTLLRARAMSDVVVRVDEALGRGGHIDVTVTAEGGLEGLTLRFGPNVTDADLAAHVDRVVAIQRASGILARCREAVTGHVDDPVGTVAGDAAHEVRKLEDMIRARIAQLQGEMSSDARQIIEADLDVFESNLARFRTLAASGDTSLSTAGIGSPRSPAPGFPDAPAGHYYRRRASGTGWEIAPEPGHTDPHMLVSDGNGGWTIERIDPTAPVDEHGVHYPPPPPGHYYRRRGDGWDLQRYPGDAADPVTIAPDSNGGWMRVGRDGRATRAAERFEATIEGRPFTRQDAFAQLTAEDSTSSFRAYWEMLRSNGLATEEEVIAAMVDPAGRTVDSVRHSLKEAMEPRIWARVGHTPEGMVLTEAESLLELQNLTAGLNQSDRGNLLERWYLARRSGSGLLAHPTMTDEANPGLVTGRGGRGVRRPDFVEGSTLVEMKATTVGLNPEDVLQIRDGLRVTASEAGTVTLEDGTTRAVNSMRVVFTDIRGARGSVEDIAAWLRDYDHLTIEIFGSDGVARTITQGNLGTRMSEANVTDLAGLLAGM